MNVTKQIVDKVLEQKLDINQWWILSMLAINEPLDNRSEKIEGWCLLLEKKGYIQHGMLSNKGKEIVKYISDGKIVAKPAIADASFNYDEWLKQLHSKLQEALFKHKKVKQIKGFGNVYFIPTRYELKEFLGRWLKKYKDQFDAEKIENILIHHVESCAKTNKFAPAVKYFIIKEGSGSQLAPALDDYVQPDKIETEYDGVNI